MNKIVLFFLFYGFSAGLFSQIVVTDADMPVTGDTIWYSIVDTNDIDYASTGADYYWNFSYLNPSSQGVNTYLRAADINLVYAGFFGINALGHKYLDTMQLGSFVLSDGYNFYETTAAVHAIKGRGLTMYGIPVPSFFSIPDSVYQFPLEYGDYDSTEFRYSVDLTDSLRYSSTGYRINDVDGWGDITTPYQSYDSCLRVKTTIFKRDSMLITGLPVPLTLNTTTIEYKWLVKGGHIPVLEISGNDGFLGYSVNSIHYRSEFDTTLQDDLEAVFYAESTTGTPADTLILHDTTDVLLSWRTWDITPGTFNYVNGTDSASKNPQVNFTQEGYYTVSLTVNTLMESDTEVKTDYIEIFTTMIGKIISSDVRVYPNPAAGVICFEIPGYYGKAEVNISNAGGQIVCAQIVESNKGSIKIPEFAEGIYFIHIKTPEKTYRRKLVLQK